jgi:alcohol dehydrogenase (cytochrome c)
VLFALLVAPLFAQQVSFDRLLRADREPQNWLSYSGTIFNERHSLLTQVTPANVKNLELQWVWQARSLEKFEATALAVDGVLYTLQGPPVQGRYQVVALDAVTGRPFWTYEYQPASEARPCCGRVSRGLAILGDTLFMGTIDARLIALDAKTGGVLWNIQAAKLGEKITDKYAITHAPLIVKDKVIVGVAGAEYGIRGFIDAYDAQTGKRAWRFYTVPGPDDPGGNTWPRGSDAYLRGGGSIWVTGTYDPEQNLVFYGTGNPGPDYFSSVREGDNLYTAAVVALDADTGRIKWHFQFTPHDVHDWDANQIPVLVNAEFGGRARSLVVMANRNGFFYVLDRTNGKVLLAKPFLRRVDWASSIGPDGRPVIKDPRGCPSDAANWSSTAYSPETRLYYFLALEECVGDKPGGYPDRTGQRFLRAVNIDTGDIAWEVPQPGAARAKTWSGVLATAGGLVFIAGTYDGLFRAFDSKTGKELWTTTLPANGHATPMTYLGKKNGRQYVVIAAGGGGAFSQKTSDALVAYALPAE